MSLDVPHIQPSYEELQAELDQIKRENLKLKQDHQQELDQLKQEQRLKGLNMLDPNHVLLYLNRCLSCWFWNKKQNCPPELAQICRYQTMTYKHYVEWLDVSDAEKEEMNLTCDPNWPVFIFDLEGDDPEHFIPINLQLPLSHFPDPNKVLVLHGCFPTGPADGKDKPREKLSRWVRFKKEFFSTF